MDCRFGFSFHYRIEQFSLIAFFSHDECVFFFLGIARDSQDGGRDPLLPLLLYMC